METRGQPNGGTWPAPGPLPLESPENTQTIEEQSYTPTLGAEEKAHGHRCGRPIVRTDIRDQQWYCGDHNLLPKRRPKLLELPGKSRHEIYKYAFPPFLGLIPQDRLEGSSIGLLTVYKQVHKEVISLMYGTKPLRLQCREDDLSIDEDFYHWDGQNYYVGEHYSGWLWNLSVLLQFLGKTTFQYVNDIEIYADLENSKDADRSILLDFVDALCTRRRTQPGRLTIKFTVATLTGKKEEVRFFRFLRALREAPEFKDPRFKLEDPDQLKGEDREKLPSESIYNKGPRVVRTET